MKRTKQFYLLFILMNFGLMLTAQDVTINSDVTTELTVCDDSESFSIDLTNNTANTITGVSLNITFPSGITYVSGSVVETTQNQTYGVSESNIADLANIDLAIGNLPKDSTVSLTFESVAGFAAIAYQNAGNIFRNGMTVSFAGGSETEQSDAYNILYGALSITSVTPQTANVFVGGTYTRVVTIVNGGFGRISALTLNDIYDSTKVKTTGTNKGVLAYTNDGATITLSAANFATIGNNDGYFDLNETITITETVFAEGCDDYQSQLNITWGCDGQTTASNDKYPYTNVSLYAPSIKNFATPSFNTCLDGSAADVQQITLINTGSGPANDMELNIYQTKDNGYDQGVSSRIDENSIQYRIGWNGTLTTLTPTSTQTTTSTGSLACLGANPVGRAILDLPVLLPGDSMIIVWDSHTCDNITECGRVDLIGWDYSLTYTDMCFQNNYSKNNQTGQAPKRKQFSVFAEYPTDLSDGQTDEFSFRLTGATFDMPETGTDAHLKVVFNIPNGLVWSGNNSDLRYVGGSTSWTPSYANYSNGVLTAHYPFPAAFNFLNSEFQLDLMGDCSGAGSGTVGVDFQLFFEMDSLCIPASEIPLTCLINTSTQLHCPGGICVGMGFNGFAVTRTSFGISDNDLNGRPDGTNALNSNLIESGRMMVGDTFNTAFTGNVHTDATYTNWQYGYASTEMPFGDSVILIGATITVYDQSTGQTLTCNNVPFTQSMSGSNRIANFDYSVATLAAQGCSDFSGFVYEDGDAVTLLGNYVVTGNIGAKTETVLITNNEFYLSDIVNPTLAANKFSCDDWDGRYTLIGYSWDNWSYSSLTLNRCEENITQYFKMQIGGGSVFNNLFPYEYRNWGHLKQVRVDVPTGYSITNGRLTSYYTTYTNANGTQNKNNLNPLSITPNGNGSSYIYDLEQLYENNGGSVYLSDDGFYGFFRATLKAACTTPQNSWESVQWNYTFNKNDFIGGGNSGEIGTSSTTDRVRFQRAVMNMSSTQQTVDGIEPTVEWTLKVKPTVGPADNAFLAFYSTDINVLEVRNASTNALITPVNGIYQLGNINQNATAQYTIKADYSICNLAPLTVFSGFDCDGYPASLGTSCGYETYELYVNPEPSQLQVRIIGKSPADPCEPRVTIEIDMLSSKLATVKDLFVTIDVPGSGSLVLEADSTMVKYPYADAYVAISNPTLSNGNYMISGANMSSTIGDDGLVGITNTSANRVKLKFNLFMNNNFTSGDFAEITVGGYRVCGLELPSVSVAYDPNSVFTKEDNATVGLNGSEDNWSTAFADYDNDGFTDLLLVNYATDGLNQLYHNDGDGTFTKVSSGNPIVTDIAPSTSGVWGDYDNDGDMDLYVSNNIGYNNFLYRNEGNGNFTSVQNDPIVNYNGYSHGAAWADYDNDGFLDMFVADYFPTRFNKLYHNNGDGTFTEVTNSPLVIGASFSVSAAWGDYDNDGDQDLFVPNTNDENNFLYRNDGNGQFSQVTTGDIVNDGGKSVGASWGDFDNDLDLDLFVSNSGGQNNFLYVNNGDGTFTKNTTNEISTAGGNSHGSAWADYDNDGDLDLVVTNDADENNFLYSNNGDGTFSEIGNSITQDAGKSFGTAWADVDNDLDLDLFIANHDNEENFLYTNERGKCTSKACLTFVGTNTNYNAIGTKIKVLATIGGVQKWQMRELSSLTGGGIGGQSDMKTLIGLGDAAQIDSMIVEWSSGVVQAFGPTQADTCLVITEQDGSKLCGTVYNDKNLNCIQDNGEDGIPNVAVTVAPGNRQVFTNENGEYAFNLAPGTYTVTQIENQTWKSSCDTVSHTVNIIGIGNEFCGHNFADTAACQNPDLNVSLATTSLRVGFESLYALTFGNAGTEPATNAILKTTFDEDIIVLSSSLPWDSKTGNEYTWNIGTLEVGQEFTIYIEDSISATAVIGENLTVISTIECDEIDCNGTDDIATDINEAVGAIDPNDILVSPEGFIANDQVLTYKIRFQNVGNDLVNTVVLRDELPENLDLSTIVRGAASHPYQFRIEGERTLVWEFANINLLDSTTNEPESHGFATFRIQPKAELADGSEIPNKAAIFFDNSAPIITNTVINIIGEPGDIKPGEMSIFPNPMTDFTVIRILPRQEGLNEEEISTIEVFTSVGTRVISLNNLTGTRVTIQRNELAAGCYIVKATSNKGVFYVSKLIIE